ncbi:MAG: GMC family oxidoreductase [Betaproteobacteria bacterium]
MTHTTLAGQPSLDATKVLWDVLVVGTGMGGGTLGHALAVAGHRVLFVEKGIVDTTLAAGTLATYPDAAPDFTRLSRAEQDAAMLSGGRSIDDVDDMSTGRRKRRNPLLGSGGGGSSALYGMAAERLFAADFTPRAQYGDIGSATLPDAWPVSYDEMVPYYEAAERLYAVRGAPDPLRPGDGSQSLLAPAAMTDTNRALFDYFVQQRLHPYAQHSACARLPDCATCQGVRCPRACKRDAMNTCVAPAVAQHGAHVLDRTAVVRLEAGRTRVESVHCERDGVALALRARYIVLAAGALFTPAILIASAGAHWARGLANGSDQVGRNLMRHATLLFLLRRGPRVEAHDNAKQLSLNDFYLPGRATADKLGTLQSLGPLPPAGVVINHVPRLLRALASPMLRRLWTRRIDRSPVLSAIMEDLPHANNRVTPGTPFTSGGRQRIRLHYKLHVHDARRAERFRRLVVELLAPFAPRAISLAHQNIALAHACGTCRFGHDPATSVLDAFNRAHELDNLYVADASYFPSSGGINPALTVAANALREAAHLRGRL